MAASNSSAFPCPSHSNHHAGSNRTRWAQMKESMYSVLSSRPPNDDLPGPSVQHIQGPQRLPQPRHVRRERRGVCNAGSNSLMPCFSGYVSDSSDSDGESHGISSERSGLSSVQISAARRDFARQWAATGGEGGNNSTSATTLAALPYPVHTQVEYTHYLVPDLNVITNSAYYWGVMNRFEAERLLDGKPEGTFLLRDSAQSEYLFSVSFRRYGRTLHARIEQRNHRFSFDCYDPTVFSADSVTGLISHYSDPGSCLFFEPQLSKPLVRRVMFSLQHLARSVIVGRLTTTDQQQQQGMMSGGSYEKMSGHHRQAMASSTYERIGGGVVTVYENIASLDLPKQLKEYLRQYHYKQAVRVRHLE